MITRVTQNCKSEIKNYFFKLKLNFQYLIQFFWRLNLNTCHSIMKQRVGYGQYKVIYNVYQFPLCDILSIFVLIRPFSGMKPEITCKCNFFDKNCNKNIVLDCMLHESLWPGIAFCFVSYIYDVWLNKYIYKKKKN